MLKRLLTAALLASVFCLAATGVLFITMRGRTVQVPNVVGKTEDEARDELDDYGLRMQAKSRIHNAQIPARSIVDQYPVAGVTVKTGQLVRVSVSLGVPPAN